MIQLNYRDSKPIYEQIKSGLRKLVITNSLAPNDKLPSVNWLQALQLILIRFKRHIMSLRQKGISTRFREKEPLWRNGKTFLRQDKTSC